MFDNTITNGISFFFFKNIIELLNNMWIEEDGTRPAKPKKKPRQGRSRENKEGSFIYLQTKPLDMLRKLSMRCVLTWRSGTSLARRGERIEKIEEADSKGNWENRRRGERIFPSSHYHLRGEISEKREVG